MIKMSGLLSAGDNAIFQGETWLLSDIIHICVYSRLHSIESTDIAPCGCGRIQFHNLKGRSWNYIELWDPIYFYQKTKNKFEIKFPHFSLVFPWESIEKYTTQNAFFECWKCLRAGSFAAPLCTRMTATFLGISTLTLIGVRSPKSLRHV